MKKETKLMLKAQQHILDMQALLVSAFVVQWDTELRSDTENMQNYIVLMHKQFKQALKLKKKIADALTLDKPKEIKDKTDV